LHSLITTFLFTDTLIIDFFALVSHLLIISPDEDVLPSKIRDVFLYHFILGAFCTVEFNY